MTLISQQYFPTPHPVCCCVFTARPRICGFIKGIGTSDMNLVILISNPGKSVDDDIIDQMFLNLQPFPARSKIGATRDCKKLRYKSPSSARTCSKNKYTPPTFSAFLIVRSTPEISSTEHSRCVPIT